MVRGYTTIEQSHKLAKILPLESADMYIYKNVFFGALSCFNGTTQIGEYIKLTDKESKAYPCWSLSALLDILPKGESVECSVFFGFYNDKGEFIEKWICSFEKEGETTDDFIIETIDGNNPVDACVAMIIKLHEMNLL